MRAHCHFWGLLSAALLVSSDGTMAQTGEVDSDMKLALARGAISGKAEGCGLDWQRRNFVPMMRYFRQTIRVDENKAALLAALHGAAQGQNAKNGCSAEVRREVQEQLDFKP